MKVMVLSLIFQYTFLTAFGQKRLVSYLAVPYSLSLIKHTACNFLVFAIDILLSLLKTFPETRENGDP